jgi:hypothetical protein
MKRKIQINKTIIAKETELGEGTILLLEKTTPYNNINNIFFTFQTRK